MIRLQAFLNFHLIKIAKKRHLFLTLIRFGNKPTWKVPGKPSTCSFQDGLNRFMMPLGKRFSQCEPSCDILRDLKPSTSKYFSRLFCSTNHTTVSFSQAII